MSAPSSQNQNERLVLSLISGKLSHRPQISSRVSETKLKDDADNKAVLPMAAPFPAAHDREIENPSTQRSKSAGTLQPGRGSRARSGGFLLNNAGTTSGYHETLYNHAESSETLKRQDVDTRLREDYGESKISRKSRKGKGKSKETVGRSPLGIEVMRPEDVADDRNWEAAASSHDRERGLLTGHPPTRTGSTPIFGTDEAQIVGLALNLSENRRRQFSAGVVSPTVHSNGSNIVSSGVLRSPTPSVPLYNLRVRPRIPIEHAELAKSPALSTRQMSAASSHLSPRIQDRSSSDSASQFSSLQSRSTSLEEPNIYPSEATILRAQKAKIAFELAYEYRRVLQYLPKLPLNQDYRPLTIRSSARHDNETSLSLGRPYNPLQYVRNRKVRGREQDLLNAEAEGWKDIHSVRSWVDRVAESTRSSAALTGSEDFLLPAFPPTSHATSFDIPSAGSSPVTHGMGSLAKELRPRSDWVATPWDMLADAYWLEQTGNAALVEDRKGRRVFSTQRMKARTYSGLGKETKFEPSKRSMSIPRSVTSTTKKSDAAAVDKTLSDRGRPRHKRLHSFTSGHDNNSSQDRRGGWRRLIRSDSSSSSDEPGTAVGQKRPKARSRATTSREQHEKLILEKQIRRLLARETDIEREDICAPAKDQNLDGSLERSSELIDPGQGVVHDETFRSGADSFKQDAETQRQSHTTNSSKNASLQDADRQLLVSAGHGRSPDPSRKRQSITINVSPPRSRSRRRLFEIDSSMPKTEQTTTTFDQNDSVRGCFHIPLKKSTNDLYSDEFTPEQSPKGNASVGQLSPQPAEPFARSRKTVGSFRHSRSRESRDFESKLRGLLKGTKIADIVGNPISKVGDLIWRKEDADDDVFQSPMSNTPDSSDLDAALSKRPSTSMEREFHTTPSKASNTRPKLPVFRLPFESGASEEDNINPSILGSGSVFEVDPGRGSDPKAGLDRPLLDMTSISSTQLGSTKTDAEKIQGDTKSLGSSNSADVGEIPQHRSTGRRGAITNDLFEPLKRQGTVYEIAIEPSASLATVWPKHDPLSYMMVTERKLLPFLTTVKRRDVQDLEVLCGSSLVVSSEIVRQVLEITELSPDSRDIMLLSLQEGKALNARAQVKLLEIQTLLRDIRTDNQESHHETTDFATRIIPEIIEQLGSMERRIAVQLTPVVRASGDHADKLSSELATTRTLELKRLNDEIDLFTRRKRRRFRWLRRSVYLALEWTLIGLMWWAWFVVVMVRIVRNSIGGFLAIMRWLLWM